MAGVHEYQHIPCDASGFFHLKSAYHQQPNLFGMEEK
jgi:hypothetical protein